jgi:hypothetical protein
MQSVIAIMFFDISHMMSPYQHQHGFIIISVGFRPRLNGRHAI